MNYQFNSTGDIDGVLQAYVFTAEIRPKNQILPHTWTGTLHAEDSDDLYDMILDLHFDVNNGCDWEDIEIKLATNPKDGKGI